jgi:hypothetical protein
MPFHQKCRQLLSPAHMGAILPSNIGAHKPRKHGLQAGKSFLVFLKNVRLNAQNAEIDVRFQKVSMIMNSSRTGTVPFGFGAEIPRKKDLPNLQIAIEGRLTKG